MVMALATSMELHHDWITCEIWELTPSGSLLYIRRRWWILATMLPITRL